VKRKVKVGEIELGGGYIAIQSMTNTNTADAEATLAQIKGLADEGCDIVRVTVKDQNDARALRKIVKNSPVPIVADIHYNYRLAIEAIKARVAKIRINPGNIGGFHRTKEVVEVAREYNTPIRIGVNAGSLEKEVLDKYGHPSADALVASALKNIEFFESIDYRNIVISMKSSDVNIMMEAYEKGSKVINYPLHLGVTEAGTIYQGTVKSVLGIGSLLAKGIGDTVRVSLTADPIEEVKLAKEILKVLNIRRDGVEIVSCPTCGRTEIDLIGLANETVEEFKDLKADLKIAVMGCVVNGPGEAKESDYGIAGGRGVGIVFKKGKVIKTCDEKDLLPALKEIIYEDLEKGKINGNS